MIHLSQGTKKNKSKLASFIFLFVFIMPASVASVLPLGTHLTYFYGVLFCYILCGVYLWESLTDKKNTQALIFTLSFVILGAVNLFVHKSTATFNIVAPVGAYIGYCFIMRKRVYLKYFDYLLILMYVYYYFTYFRTLPGLLYRPDFNEETVFAIASSNAIAIGLNMVLYAYMIFNKLNNEARHKNILYFAIINFVLIVIQQSRAGLVIALVLLTMSAYELNKKKFLGYLAFAIPILLAVAFFSLTMILDYIDLLGNVNVLEALTDDVRGESQAAFFKDMDFNAFLFGYSSKVFGESGLTYTYNVFLDIWSRYGVLQLVIMLSMYTKRFTQRRKFYFPLYYFIPFFAYSALESIFLPSFWDVIVFIPMFTRNFTTPSV